MKKLLLALMALAATTAYAEDILWFEDFSTFKEDSVPTGGTYKYVTTSGASTSKIYKEALATGTAPELLISKKSDKAAGGSFSATIPMNGKSGDLTLSYLTNKTLVVSSEDATIGKAQKSGNSVTIPVSVAAGKETITIVFKNETTSNARFDNVKLYQGEAKKNPGFSWGTASRSVVLGSEENNFPTLTNANNLEVTYSSSNTEVATISADGQITLIAGGKTNITASFAGNDEFEAASATYELTVTVPSTVDLTNTPETAYSVTKALELIAAGEGLKSSVYVAGKIKSISEIDQTGSYGNATYIITDGTSDLTVYRGYGLGGQKFNAENAVIIKVDDEVIVYGKLVDYNGTKEFSTGSTIYSINGNTSIASLQSELGNTIIYNIAGQRVTEMKAPGIYIVNGKKRTIR